MKTIEKWCFNQQLLSSSAPPPRAGTTGTHIPIDLVASLHCPHAMHHKCIVLLRTGTVDPAQRRQGPENHS